ncbi:hypothetical protein D3C80_1047060 [compost metagenome]
MTQKLTKAQRELFGQFAKNITGNHIGPLLAIQGVEATIEDIDSVVSDLDLNDLTEAIGQHFLADCSFVEVKRVFKIMQDEEFRKVMLASQTVADAVQESIVKVLATVIPTEEDFPEGHFDN